MSTFKKYFNATTISGRANVAKATYASFAALYLIHRLRRKGQKPEDEHKDDHSAKGLRGESHQHTHDPKTEPESSCPCKCNENADAFDGHSHSGNSGNHSDHSGVDESHSNSRNPGHHNGTKDEKPHNDDRDTNGKSADNVSYDQSKSSESSKCSKFREIIGFIHGR